MRPLHRVYRILRAAILLVVFAIAIAALWLAPALPVMARSGLASFQFSMSTKLQNLFDQDPSPPSATRELSEPVRLRFSPTKHFSYAWAGFDSLGEGQAFLTEGFVMEGAIQAMKGSLVWRYGLFNLGHDRVLRQLGEMEVTTDEVGKPTAARALSRNTPPGLGQMRSLSYRYLDPEDFEFPLCCLPSDALRQGSRVAERLQRGIGWAYPNTDLQPVVRGVVREGGRRFIVLEHSGNADVGDQNLRVSLAAHGVVRIDLDAPWRRNGIERVTSNIPLGDGRMQAVKILHAVGDEQGDFLHWR